ncbi:MAG TPA: HypC/HybG/HupF family hydrogenase formation chaperone, partial [Candidatus Limnocylindrales bacterium]|nr:HypC/HybG/HupF family hydrogenase formation chaperone [Candidatus Limnocylindrales bacterium]
HARVEMCLEFPGRITAVDAGGATVDTEGRLRRASTLLSPDVRGGAWVTVAAGTIIARLSDEDAAAIRRELNAAIARSGT